MFGFVRCWKPNGLTCVGLILTCWVSNACWSEDVSVLVGLKDVLFCSMLDTYFGCLVLACRVCWRGLLVGWLGGWRRLGWLHVAGYLPVFEY